MSNGHDELRESLGAYVLGQLDADMRRVVQEHLLECDECRADVEDLAPLAAGLRLVEPDDLGLVGVMPPVELDRRIEAILPTSDTGRTRRSRRWTAAVGGAVVGAAAATLVAVTVPRDPTTVPGPTIVAIGGVESTAGVSATAGLVDHTWGVEIKIRAKGLPAGQTYDVRVIGDDGTSHDAGAFIGVGEKTINCNMSSSVLLADATSFEVLDAEGNEVIGGALPS